MHACGLNDRLGSLRSSPLPNPAGAGCGQFGLRWTLRPSHAGCTPAWVTRRFATRTSKGKPALWEIVVGALRGALLAPRNPWRGQNLDVSQFAKVSPHGIYRHHAPGSIIGRPLSASLVFSAKVTDGNQMEVYLNNCRCFDHVASYGRDAFFDLNTFGRQATQARDLLPGQQCVVASYTDDGDVVFNRYRFTRETIEKHPDDPKSKVRVFRGKWLGAKTLPKSKAAKTKPFSVFFNKLTHFKRPSVIKP